MSAGPGLRTAAAPSIRLMAAPSQGACGWRHPAVADEYGWGLHTILTTIMGAVHLVRTDRTRRQRLCCRTIRASSHKRRLTLYRT